MSLALYEIESLRFYTEEEILLRNQFTARLFNKLKQTLLDMNQAWKFHRVEGPLLTPRNHVSDSYDENDIFITQIKKANQELVLRPETTKSSYLYANSLYPTQMQKKLPVCIWQLGKSFRVEKSDGATAAALRFNEFYQLEFQCIYSNTTLADYRKTLIEALIKELSMILGGNKIRTIESDRLPSYSESTLDIETIFNGKWKEIASCSIRNDFSDTTKVCEIANSFARKATILNEPKNYMSVNIKPKDKILHIPGIDEPIGYWSSEHETILPAGTNLKLIKKSKHGNDNVFHFQIHSQVLRHDPNND